MRCFLELSGLFQKSLFPQIVIQSHRNYSQNKQSQPMLFWCHSCSKITLPSNALKCQYCSSPAIEEIQENNNPSQYIPPSVPVSTHQQPTNHTHEQVIEQNEDPFAQFFSIFRPQRVMERVMVRAYFPEPVFSFFRVVQFPEEDQRKSVDEEKMQQLQKIQRLSHECAVCQEREGAGLRLACKHEFHENCIKPWFSNSNTCPCCRSVV